MCPGDHIPAFPLPLFLKGSRGLLLELGDPDTPLALTLKMNQLSPNYSDQSDSGLMEVNSIYDKVRACLILELKSVPLKFLKAGFDGVKYFKLEVIFKCMSTP